MNDPLCGWEWLNKHRGQYDDFVPRIEIIRPGSKQTIIVKSREAERAVVRILRENKKKGCKK